MTNSELGREEKMQVERASNFIHEIIEDDIKANKHNGIVQTRFPPEPNGYLHIGHAKSICLNFGIAQKYSGKCNLRFDDTNPAKEETEYVDSIMEDVRWLGFNWDAVYYASDYFDQMYIWAEQLILQGDAFVDDSTGEEIRLSRGTLTEPGKESPYRNRTINENLELFRGMRSGTFPDSSKTLRAKIDMNSPNINMRDPIMYRILRANHHRTGDKWCIYPMYDWAHGESDSIEKVTHSICTLEFENHRPLYDWFLEKLGIFHPRQIEFARLNITYTLMSKRKLLELVNENYVTGWDDPRMPTICGYRRRGYTPESIRLFADRIGVAKRDNMIDVAQLENCVREDLNKSANRMMAVLNPLKVVIENYADNFTENLNGVNNPEDAAKGSRTIKFSKEIYIEQDDFMENPSKQFHRLAPGTEVRLRYAYIIKCEKVIKNEQGEVIELRCSYDIDTKSGTGTSPKKVKGTIHWVSAEFGKSSEVRLYDRLFTIEDPAGIKDGNWRDAINPHSLVVVSDAKIEPALSECVVGDRVQFERLGYFAVDKDSTADKIVFNRAVSLRDSWAKIEKKNK